VAERRSGLLTDEERSREAGRAREARPVSVFYYDTNSPYAYLAAMRVDEVLPGVQWRPMAFGILIREIGKRPWSLGEERPAGVAEIERRAAERGLPPLRWHEDWPVGTYSLEPLRALVFAEERGVQRELALALYRAFFAEGRSLAEPENVLAAASAVGLDSGEVRAAIADDRIKERLKHNTDEALGLGVTGVPTVVVDGEIFWGDDRL
jgi:2-hydroxychromene-2-carboxylate isomerase